MAKMGGDALLSMPVALGLPGDYDGFDCGNNVTACILESQFNNVQYEKIGGPYDSADECRASCCCGNSELVECCSCECNEITVTLTTTGCCLYLGANSIEAVGKGTVTAEISQSEVGDTDQKCILSFYVNGESSGNFADGTPTSKVLTLPVEDGDSLDVEVFGRPEGNFPGVGDGCNICEIERTCSNISEARTSLWLQKSGKEKKTIAIDKKELVKKVKFVTDRISKRKKGLG